jgi:peptidoglycan/LPS O-acetylase OafA/YrhL
MERLEYYKPLDGVRGMAALMVMWFHFYWVGNNQLISAIRKASVFGQTGVSLFFVLSGFLITRILLFNKQNPANYFGNFYIRRSLRIFPLYFLFLGIYYFLVPLFFHTPYIPSGEQVYFWTYLQNFSQTFGWNGKGPDQFWSLAVEEHFYLFWPFLIYFLNPKQIKRTILGLILAAVLLRIVLVRAGYPVFYWTFTNMDSLALGALLAVFEAEQALTGKSNTLLSKGIGYLVLPAIIPLWVLFEGAKTPSIQVIKPLLISSIYYLLIFFIIRPQGNNAIKKFFSNPFLVFTGKISYGLYVYHPLCFWIVARTSLQGHLILLFAVSFSLAFMVSLISYHFFEKQFLNLKTRFEYQASGKSRRKDREGKIPAFPYLNRL